MCLWSVHPKYLDKCGLVALWREGLRAQKNLSGESGKIPNDPQLIRFKQQDNPLQAIGAYLSFITCEALRQGCKFNHEKIMFPNFENAFLSVSEAELAEETERLKAKLHQRSEEKYEQLCQQQKIEINPVFNLQ